MSVDLILLFDFITVPLSLPFIFISLCDALVRIAYGNIKLVGSDLSYREFIVFFPLVLGTIVMGIYPDIFFGPMHASVSNLVWIDLWI